MGQMKPRPMGDGYKGATPHAKHAVVGKPGGVGSSKGKGYDGSSHKGTGKNQKLLWPAVGEGYTKPTPNSGSAVVADGVGGGKGKGYQNDAHSAFHHGPDGEAVGSHTDHHMEWKTPLQTEKLVGMPKEGANGKAAHHPHMGSEPHRFQNNKTGHGYGHSTAQMRGPLRMSGHSKAHRLGCK